MTGRLLVLSGLALWAGLALLLSQLRWFSRPRLVDRLRPFAPGRQARGSRSLLSAGTFGEVLRPLASSLGEAASRVFGYPDDVGHRLARIHSPMSASSFRVRQLGWSGAAALVALAAIAGARPPGAIALLALPAACAAAYALTEYQLARACARWDERRLLELPVLAEQLAMLVAAGFSLGSALDRAAERGRGACASDLALVCGRVRQGLTHRRALQEWAALVQSPAVDRLVAVLCIGGDSSDLGRLLSDEARALRRQVQRRALETMDRRSQQVWVPVTVAALVPGVVLLAVPFAEALRLFTG